MMWVLSLSGIALRLAGAGFGFLWVILLARILAPAEYGVYALVMAAAALAAMAAPLGWHHLAVREAANATAHENWPGLRGILLVSTGTALGLSVVLAFLAYGIVSAGGVGGLSPEAAAYGAVIVPMAALCLVWSGVLCGSHHVIGGMVPETFVRPLVALCAGFGLMAYGFLNSAEDALRAQVIAFGVAVLVSGSLVLAVSPRAVRTGPAQYPRPDWLKVSMPFCLTGFVRILRLHLPLYLLGILSVLDQVGVFAVAAQFAGLLGMALVSVNQPLKGRFVDAWSKEDRRKAQQLVTEAARISSGLTLAGALVIIVFAEKLLGLLGEEYEPAAQAMRILAMAHVTITLIGPSDIILGMAGGQNYVLGTSLLALLVTLGLAVAIVPVYGALGMALAVAAGLIFSQSVLAIVSWKRLGLFTPIAGWRRAGHAV